MSVAIAGFRPGPAALRVIRTDPATDPRWMRLVMTHPDATIYHHPAWISALESEYGQQSEHLACEGESGNLLAILPLIRTQGLPFKIGGAVGGRRLASLPRTPIAGPLAVEPAAAATLLKGAVRLVGNRGGRLQIKCAGQKLDGLVEELVCSPWRTSYLLDLPDAASGPFQVADAKERNKLKRNLAKGARYGLTVRAAETEADIRVWYTMYLETMRHNMVPPRPFRFFTALWKNLRSQNLMELLLAEIPEGEGLKIIAGSIFFKFGQTVSYSFGAMNRRYGTFCANDAIHWTAITKASAQGFRCFDFGEVPDGYADLARFKLKWGARPQLLYRYYAPGLKLDGQKEIADGHPLGRAIWCRMPLRLTEWLGDRVYNYL